MTKRKFTKPTEFPAEYVDRDGNKAVILGRAPNEVFPFIGYDADGCARDWTKKGKYLTEGKSTFDLHDEREDYDALQEVTAELEQAEARIEELEDTLSLRTNLHGEATYLIHKLEAKLAKTMEVVEMIASADVDAVLGQAVDISCEIIGELMEEEEDE